MSNKDKKVLSSEDNDIKDENYSTEEENYSSDEEESKVKITCEGCLYNSMSQYDHMDYGGCLYVPDCGITIRGKRYGD